MAGFSFRVVIVSFAATTSVPLTVATRPSPSVTRSPNATGAFFSQQKPPCDAPWRGGVEKWNRCQHEQMWLDRPMPLYGLHGVKTPGGAVTTVLVALGLLGCLWLLRGELSPRGARLS